jgi:hypothetical protein
MLLHNQMVHESTPTSFPVARPASILPTKMVVDNLIVDAPICNTLSMLNEDLDQFSMEWKNGFQGKSLQ